MTVEVSIIMPMFNTAPYLKECIDSILTQDYSDWELIIVDDHSTDESAVIAKKYAGLDSRINIYNNIEKGIIPALQLGYEMSNGRYITRMDSDDVMVPSKIRLLREALVDEEEVSVGKVMYFSDGKELAAGYTNYASWLNNLVDSNSHFQNIYKECVIPSPCWMMRRTTFDKIGSFGGFGYPEDYDLVFRMYTARVHVKTVDQVLHKWRDHDSRASRNDPNYSDQSFLPLKLHYFINHDYKKKMNLCLWGGGKAGKSIAKHLISKEIQFDWYTDNVNKIGHNIYGVILKNSVELEKIKYCQLITAVRVPGFEEEGKLLFERLSSRGSRVYHFH